MTKNQLTKDVLREWILSKKKYIKESTYTYYLYEIENYIIPVLGEYKISEINEKCIQEAVLHWQQYGGKEKQSLKKSTVQNLVTLIKQVMRYAVKEGGCKENPLEIHFIPTQVEQKKNVFTLEEQHLIMNTICKTPNFREFGIFLCLNSGLRIGDLCALQWTDIDFQNRVVHITKTMQRIYNKRSNPKTKIIISAPKTRTSVREIPLSGNTMNLIKQLPSLNVQGYILTNSNRYMEPRAIRKYYNNFLLKLGIQPINFHCLRHTFATRCIENGANYKTVSELLGHSSINTTLNLYVHPPISEKRKCVELIQ